MATEAQIAANRKNAQASTGPKTPEGKARSSRNAVSLGLFTKHNCVQPEEREEYDNLYDALWQDLNPSGAMEQMFATEIVRGAWSLRRCAIVEATLAIWVNNRTRQEHEEKNGHGTPGPRACDPMIEEYSQPTQASRPCPGRRHSSPRHRRTAPSPDRTPVPRRHASRKRGRLPLRPRQLP